MPHRLFVAATFLLAFNARQPCLAAGPYQAPAQHLTEALRQLPADSGTVQQEPQRLVAAALALTLGVFGAHRLYLGTGAKVPIIYGLTFGGFGVLVLIDLGQILFAKRLQPFLGNDQVFMWSKGRKEELTPP